VKDDDLNDHLEKQNSSEFFIKQFKQYLVNKKVNQAFDILDNNQAKIADTERFFSLMTQSFRNILEDPKLELIFVKSNFDFHLQLSTGQKITFENLSDGFSALISILMDLFMRVDIIRKEVKDFSYNPCGIVLIDEPETHLHLKLQYEVMPLLTGLFPNVQFIVATHSPAVISSIKNATVFDLTSKSTETESIVGSSFSELMVSHFGLDNEYSNIADDIFAQINHIIKTETDPQARKKRLQTVLTENERYLSPAMQLELESMILELQ
jgi:predicted ATP-dependent endonuclease of OLD family